MSNELAIFLPHAALALALMAGGALALFLLPWTDEEVARTGRDLARVARRIRGGGVRVPALGSLAR